MVPGVLIAIRLPESVGDVTLKDPTYGKNPPAVTPYNGQTPHLDPIVYIPYRAQSSPSRGKPKKSQVKIMPRRNTGEINLTLELYGFTAVCYNL
jgi:hypothetical protein